MCYGKTSYTPGRYLEDGLKSIGLTVDLFQNEIDFKDIDTSEYCAVLFVESPSRPIVKTKNIELVDIPKLFWIHHGENRLKTNMKLVEMYKPDIILMAHSLHLANNFSVPTRFFPFGMAQDIFDCSRELKERVYDVAFVGSRHQEYYQERTKALNAIQKQFENKYQLSLNSHVFLNELAQQYSKSKIVVNHTADQIKSLNMRIFEGMSCGSLVITDYVPGQEKLFIDNQHYVIYNNHNELLEKIDYYLNHLDEAQKIASNGYNHLKSTHKYTNRAYQLIEIIKEFSKS